jgi:hypothetical protein
MDKLFCRIFNAYGKVIKPSKDYVHGEKHGNFGLCTL